MAYVATAAGGEQGKVICFRCRRACGDRGCRCRVVETAKAEWSATVVGLWLGGAALAGSLLGAALALLSG